MPEPSFQGKVIGHPATLTVGNDGIALSVTLPIATVEQVKVARDCVAIRVGNTTIWFASPDADEIASTLGGRLPERPEEPPAPTPPARRRGRRHRRG